MEVDADASAFSAKVDEIKDRLAKLNVDGSLSGFVARFDRLLCNLPADLFETEIVPASGTNDINSFSVVLLPGPRLNAIASTLWAFDINAHDPLLITVKDHK